MRYLPDFTIKLFDISPIYFKTIASSIYGSILELKENNKNFKKYLYELKESQWWSKNDLEERQCVLLKKLILHVYKNVPYYREIFEKYDISPAQIQTTDDLKILPVLDKKTIKKKWNELLVKNYDIKKLRSEYTSGTTGTPLKFLIDDKTYFRQKAIQWLQYSWAGYSRNDWIGILSGYKVVSSNIKKPPFWITNYNGKQIHFSTYHLNPKNIVYYIKKLEKKKIKYLLGYPSAIGLLAQYIVKLNKKIKLKAVFLSSETILDYHRSAIQVAFECPIFDFYGQAERVLFAANCKDSENLHINMETGIAELIPANKDKKKSRIIATSLINYVMPLIRYEINDITTEIYSECPCGRKHKLIGPIESRTGDYILTNDGTHLSPRLLSIMFHDLKGIMASQIIQYDYDHLIIKILPDKNFNNEEELLLKQRIKKTVGKQIKVEIEKIKKIPLEKNGKYRFVISKVKL